MRDKYPMIAALICLPLVLLGQTPLWSALYKPGGPGFSWISDACIDDKFNVYIAGSAYLATKQYDGAVIKYNKDGEQQWPYLSKLPYNDQVRMMCQDKNHLYITGFSQHDPNSALATQIVTTKINKFNGTIGSGNWPQFYGPPYGSSKGYAITMDQKGYIYVAGTTRGDGVVLKYDSLGNLIWAAIHNDTFSGFWKSIVIDNAGEIFVMGRASKWYLDKDVGVAKYSADDGALLAFQTWQPDPYETWIDNPTGDIDYDNAGNIYLAGQTQRGPPRPVVLKYNNELDLIWEYHYYDPWNNSCGPNDLVVCRATGTSYITGVVDRSTEKLNVLTMAIDANGNRLWIAEHSSPAGGSDVGWELAISPLCVYVTGYYNYEPADFLTLCYWRKPYAKQLLWAKTYDFGGNDQASAIALRPLSPRTTYVVCAGQRLTSPYAFATVLYRCREPFDMIVDRLAPSNIPEATAYNNSRRLIRDANNTLHLCFTNDDGIYHTYLTDTTWSEPTYVGAGKYPALALGPDGKLYCLWSYNEGAPTFLEELRMSSYDGKRWSKAIALMNTYWSFYWGIGAPSFAIKDTMGYFTFESYQGHTYHTPPEVHIPVVIALTGRTLLYGNFSLLNPENLSYRPVDLIVQWPSPIPIETLYLDSLLEELTSPSITVDLAGLPRILWEGDGTQMRYYTIADTTITKELFDSAVDFPFLAMNGDQVQLFYIARDSIRYRYGWTGTTNLSQIQTVAKCKNPFPSGPYLTWTKQEGIYSSLYYGKIPASGMIEPFKLASMETDLFTYPQIFYNAPRHNTPASLDMVWTEYCVSDSLSDIFYINIPIEEPPPIYTFDMGTETPVPICIQRDGYKVLGPEDYQSFDFDSTELIYHLTLHSPHTKYRIRWIWYHEEQKRIKLQLSIDDILHRNRWVEPHKKVIEEAWIPAACLHDNKITIKVKKLVGTLAVLSGFEIEVKGVGGGPQGTEAVIAKPFTFEHLYPNPTKSTFMIRFTSPAEEQVNINLYDVGGRLVAKIFNGSSKIGVNEIQYTPEKLSAGVYFLEIKTKEYQHTEKVVYLH